MRTMSCGAVSVMSLPWKTIRPSRGWLRPLIERSVVDLPAPFAPISVTISPVRTVERDTLERLDRPVVRVDVVHLEDDASFGGDAAGCPLPSFCQGSFHAVAAVPRYASMTRWSCWISFGVPSAIFSP